MQLRIPCNYIFHEYDVQLRLHIKLHISTQLPAQRYIIFKNVRFHEYLLGSILSICMQMNR